jgi:hypothetical protein
MNLPDAPIAHDGFFATHFCTVRDQEKSKDVYVRILGGKVIKPDRAALSWLIPGFSTPAVARLPISPGFSSKHRRISTE